MAKGGKGGTPTPTAVGPTVLGPHAAAVKAAATPQQWRRIVKAAHDKGFTVDSYSDTSTPDALKAKTQEGLRQQAYATVSTSYKPIEAELGQRAKDIAAVGAKRAADDKYYRDWLATKQQQVATSNLAANESLRDVGRSASEGLATYYSKLPGQLQQQAAASPGAVSDPTQSTALGRNIQQQGTHDVALQDQLVAHGRDQAKLADDQAAASDKNQWAAMAALSAKRASETWKSLDQVRSDQGKLATDKQAKIAEAITGLQNTERQKANSNRDFAAVAERLHLQGTALDVKALGIKTTARTNADKLAETKRAALTSEALAADANNIKRDALAITKATNADKTKLGWYNASTSRRNQESADYARKHPNAKKGDKGKTPPDPQVRYEDAYAKLVISRTSDGKPYTLDYVSKNRGRLIAAVEASTKVSRTLATRVVDAFIRNGGDASQAPGTYHQVGARPGDGPH